LYLDIYLLRNLFSLFFLLVNRDEQSAGKIDEILAQLEFICAEESLRKSDDISVSNLSQEPGLLALGERNINKYEGKY
jgi:hypothetical protein